MRKRNPSLYRAVARVLLVVTAVMNVWQIAPPVVHARAGAVAAAEGQAGASAQFFGPRRFTRTTGAPNVYTATVTVPAGVNGPFTLHLQNGEPNGSNRISSATIEMNGVTIAGPSDFNQNVAGFDRTVTLGATNTLRVTLRSSPGSYVTISIGGATGDQTAPAMALLAPVPGTVINTRTPQLVIAYSDPGAGASGVNVNSLIVQIDGVDRSALFSRGATQATAQLPAANALSDGSHAIQASISDLGGNIGVLNASFVVDVTAPTIETIQPAPGAFVNTGRPTIRVRYADSDGVVLSTLHVLVNGQDRTALFTKGATEAVGTLDAASAVPDGASTIVATIQDAGGNVGQTTSTFVVDTAVPTIEVVEPGLDHYSAAGAIDVSGTVNDASPVTVTVNGVSAALTGASFTATGVPLGAGPDVALQVTATDAAGNSAQVSRTVHIDRVNPTVQITSPAPGAYLGASSVVVTGATDDTSPVTVTVNDVAATVNGSSFSATLSAVNGPTPIHVVVEDAAGNTVTADLAVVVDTIAPSVTVNAPAEGFVTNAGSVQVTGTVNDASPVTVTINGVVAPVNSGAFSASAALSTGANTLTVVAVDAAGNAAQSVVHGSLDQVAPTLAVAAPSNGSYLATSAPTVRVTFADNGSVNTSSLQISVDGVDRTALFSLSNGEATATLPALADGSHQIAATVADVAGNQSTAGAAFFTDTAGPSLQITSPAANAYLKGPSVAVTGTVADLAIASVVVNGVAATVTGGSFAATVSAADGPLTITAVARDAAGNESTATTAVRLDSAAPVVTVTAPASGYLINAATVHVTGTVADSSPVTLIIAGATVSVTGGAFEHDVATGADGGQTIGLIATDAAGNSGEAFVLVNVDRAAPSLAITSPAAGAFVRGPSVLVSGTVADASTTAVVVNGVSASVSAGEFSATVPVDDGATTIDATATDAAGNVATASASITVDSVAPVITVVQPADGQYTNATSIGVSGGVSDATAVSVTVNGVAASVSGSDFTATVAVGNDSTSPIEVVATDAAGNTSHQSLSVRVDRIAPTVTITSPSPGSFFKGPVFDVSGTVSDASPVNVEVNGLLALVSGGTFTVQVASIDGPLTVTAIARDAAGNAATAEVALTVDSIAPVITVQSPADGSITNQSTAHIVGSVSDASAVSLQVGGLVVGLTDNAFAFDYPLGAEGDKVVTLRARDAAGNESTFDVRVTLDQTPPDLEITFPAPNAVLGSAPVAAHGFVYDATATTVTVNGFSAARTQDAWQVSLDLGEGTTPITVTATDAAGNIRTLTRTATVDLVAPTIAISAPASDTLTNATSVQVTGTALDTTLTSVTINGVPAALAGTAFSANVLLAIEGDNHLIAVATDALNRSSQAEVIVNRDTTPPNVSISAPDTFSRLRSASATIAASDTVGLQSIDVTLNGISIGNSTTAPFSVPLAVPASATVGATFALVATATDRAGNTSTASHSLRVIADGVVVGQVLTDATGLPLPGATVTMLNAGGAAGDEFTTDDRGGYSLPTGDATVLLAIAMPGMTTVERQVPIQNGVGTAVVDARLTTLVASGLTPLSPQGLPALLPLGWSPIAAFDVRGNAVGAPIASPSGTVAQGYSPAVLATYSTPLHAWLVVTPQLAAANGSFSFTPAAAGAYALVVPDLMDPPIVVPDADQPLTGVELKVLPVTATAAGVVSPSAIPPTGGTATGQLAIQSPQPLPSGTIVQAQVTETYNLTTGAVASEEQRTEDIVLYRRPSASADAALSATFPIAPSRTYQTTALATGTVHLDILAGRESVRGQTGGNEPLTVDAGDGLSITVPAHALTGDTAVRVQRAVLSAFLPGAVDTSPQDVTPLGEVVVDFSSRTLTLSAELTIAAPTDSPQGPVSYLLGRVVRIDGIPRVLIVATAEIVGSRLVSRGMVGLPGIAVSGRYVFYRVASEVGFVTGTLSASGSPVAGLIESASLPFVGVAGPDGRFVIATRAADVQLTGRVSGTALQGTASVNVTANAITSRDIVLAGSVTTSTVSPADGATLVPVSSQLEIITTAPLDTNAVGNAVITLTDVSQNTTIAIRRVLAGAGQLLAVVPTAALAAATTYRLDVSGLFDVYGGAVSVVPVSFTTKADTPATFDPELITVSFPDDNGLVHVVAPPGAVPALTQVLVVNAGNGVVASFQAGNDGSMDGDLTASIRDRLIVTITDPQGRSFNFERSTYVAADGTTGVGSGGGKIKSATTPVELLIPDGAIDDAVLFKLDAFDITATFPNDPLPDVPGAHLGTGVKIDAQAGLQLNKEAKLSFPKPADAPEGAFYYVYRRLQGPDGRIAYETLDHAFPDPATGKIVTASPPFAGYINSIDGFSVMGAVNPAGAPAVGAMLTNYAIYMWTFDQALPGRALGGVITGKVLRPEFVNGATTPTFKGVEGAYVSGVDAGGTPLAEFHSGFNVAVSQKDGTFTFIDNRYVGGPVQLTAWTKDGAIAYATAFESNPQDLKSPGLGVYRNIATANITLPALAAPPKPPLVDVRMFTTVAGVLKEVKTGVVVVGNPVTFGFEAKNIEVTSANIQTTQLSVHDDTLKATGMSLISESYTPQVPGSYTLNAVAPQAFGPPLITPFTFRVIASGGSATANLPNDAPAVVTGLTVPRNNATGVPPSVFPQVSFTEPVKNIVGNVELRTGSTLVATIISADGPDGPIASVTSAAQVVTSLTIQPEQPLEYGKTYTLTLSSAIVDLDKNANDEPAPKALIPYTTTFTTFGPEKVGQSGDTVSSASIVVMGDRGYLAVPQPNNTALKVYNLVDPTKPEELPQDPVTLAIGYPFDLVGEDNSVLLGETGRVVAMTTGPLGIPYRPSNAYLYDVTTDQPTWIGAVTLGNSPVDGIARRTVMKDGMLYAATIGVGKGIQVVSLSKAMENFAAATSEGTANPKYFTMMKQLGLEGQGFGQDAIVNTVFVDTGSGNMSRLWDLAVGDLDMDGVPTRLVAATGQTALAIADPVSSQLLFNGPVYNEQLQPALNWGYNIALARLGQRDIALVVGFVTNVGNLRLVAVDVTNPRAPMAIGSITLTSDQVDTRSRLIVRDGIALLGGLNATTLVDVADPRHLRVIGTVEGITSNLALSAEKLLFSVGSPLSTKGATGVRTAALERTVLITEVKPEPVALRNGVTVEPVQLNVRVIPPTYEVKTVAIDVTHDDTVLTTLAVNDGVAFLPPAFPFNPEQLYNAQAFVNRDDPETVLKSPKRPLQPATVEFVLTNEVDDNGPMDVVKVLDARPFVTIDTLQHSFTPQGLQIDVTGTVRDAVAPVDKVFISGEEATVTPVAGDLSKSTFKGRVTIAGAIDILVTATAVNSLGNTGWASKWIIRNPTLTGDPGGNTVRDGVSVPPALPDVLKNQFKIQVRNGGIPTRGSVEVRIQTDSEERSFILKRAAPGRFNSEDILPVPEQYTMPAGLSNLVKRDLEKRRIRMPIGTSPRVIYGPRVIDHAIATGMKVVDEQGNDYKFVPGNVAAPKVTLDVVEVNVTTRSARLAGRVTDPVAAVSPESVPTVKVGANDVPLTNAGPGAFTFDVPWIPVPMPTSHLVVRAENATGAFGQDGRIITLDGANGPLAEAIVEDDGVPESGATAKPMRVKIFGPKLPAGAISGSLTGDFSQVVPPPTANVALTFQEDPRTVGRTESVHEYVSSTFLPSVLPGHRRMTPVTPATITEAAIVPVEVGGLLRLTATLGAAGTYDGSAEVSGLEIVTPRDASIINAGKMLLSDGNGMALPVTLKWHGLTGVVKVGEIAPGEELKADGTPFTTQFDGEFVLSSKQSITATRLLAVAGEEAILTAEGGDADGSLHASESAFFSFTQDTAAAPEPFANTFGAWTRFTDAEAVWLRNGVFLMPDVMDGLELVYPAGRSDRQISEHLEKNGLRPIALKRNGGTVVAVMRVDGKDVFDDDFVEGIEDGPIVTGRPPTPLPDQIIDGDDLTWQDILDAGSNPQGVNYALWWDLSYDLAPGYGVRRRSEIIQQIRAKNGLPPSEGGVSREYKDFKTHVLSDFWGDVQEVFLTVIGFFTGFTANVAFFVIDAAADEYRIQYVNASGAPVAAASIPAMLVVRPTAHPAAFVEVDTGKAVYKSLASQYATAQRARGSYLAKSTPAREAAGKAMVTLSNQLGELGATQFAEETLHLSPGSRVCCSGATMGGGATGKFDLVYEAGNKFTIIEAKGGKRYASFSTLTGRTIGTGAGERHFLQGTKEYVEDVVKNMLKTAEPGSAELAMAERMDAAIRAGQWSRFDHYIVSTKWSRGAIRLRWGARLVEAVAPKIKYIKSIF